MGKRFGDTEFTQPERELVMIATVLCGGNSAETHRQLTANPPKELNRVPSNDAIKSWKNTDRYEEIKRELTPKLERKLAHRALELAMQAQDVIGDAIEETSAQIKAGTIKDPSAAAKNLTLSHGILIDKNLTLTGRPTQITEHRDAASLLRALQAKGIIEGTAVEEPVPQLTEGS